MNRRDFFNAAAVSWDGRFQTKELLAFLEQLVPKFQIKQGQKVLDIGTGTGVLIPFLLKAVGPTGHVTAIDYAEKMIEKCRSKYGHLPNVSLSVQKIEEFYYPSASFDAVTCFGLFPHLEKREHALRKVSRVLKPHGRLVIAHALGSAEIKAHHKGSATVAHDVLPASSEMRRLLKQAGFTRIRITDKPGCYLCLSDKSASCPPY